MEKLKKTQLRRLSMSLLLIFVSIMRHRRLSAVAQELGLTKSAISHALDRLRDIFDDELFLHRHAGIQPTPRALALEPEISKAIDMLSRALSGGQEFDPSADRRSLRLGVGDYGGALFGGPLAAVMQREAPHMRLSLRSLSSMEMLEQVSRKGLDLALGNFYGAANNLVSEELYRESFVVVARRGHPKIAQRLTRKIYLECEHLAVAHELGGASTVENSFAALGVQRKVVMATTLYFSGFAAAKASDRLLTAPRYLAERYAAPLGLVTYPLPFPDIDFRMTMIFHPHSAHDPAIMWLRNRLRAIAPNTKPAADGKD
jgi:DNA-binding transcriptional LysR family regulator